MSMVSSRTEHSGIVQQAIFREYAAVNMEIRQLVSGKNKAEKLQELRAITDKTMITATSRLFPNKHDGMRQSFLHIGNDGKSIVCNMHLNISTIFFYILFVKFQSNFLCTNLKQY